MVSQSQQVIEITMPAGFAPAGGSNILRLPLIADKDIRGGRRAIERQFVDANKSPTPSRRQRVEWAIHGPTGASLQSSAGYLGLNFTRNLDGRWFQRLLPVAEQTLVNLTSKDPPGIHGAIFDVGIFDFSYFGSDLGTGTSGLGPDVTAMAEQDDYLLVGRGALLTQVDTRTTPWTVVSTTVLNAPVLDMDHWFGNVYIAQSWPQPLLRVLAATATGVVTQNVSSTSPSGSVYALSLARGSDRMWYINGDTTSNTYNFASFTLDAFVNLAAPFQVGDPVAGMNGIGPFGPLTFFGGVDNLYSFTDQGKPIPLSRALYSHHSTLNGKQWADPGWGWNFATTGIGLRAISQWGTDNPVGIGETMRQFTGHNGVAQTVWSERGELWGVYYTTSGESYGYRCTFGNETGGSGQPLLFPWFYKASTFSQAIFSTVTGAPSQGVFIIHGDGTNLVHSTIASDGRDDLYPSYTYDTGGGTAYLTTLNRDVNLQKTLTLARLRTRNMTNATWTLAFGFDLDPANVAGGTYIDIGSVTTNGSQTLLPISNHAPIAGIYGETITPRLTLAISGGVSTNHPEIDGTLEVEYDERPQQSELISLGVHFTSVPGRDENEVWDLMQRLAGEDSPIPVYVQIPDNKPPGVSISSAGGYYYGFITGVTKRQDMANDAIEGYTVMLSCWPQADQI